MCNGHAMYMAALLRMRVQSATANSHHLSADLFEAAAMKAVEKDLLAMKVGELKEELEVRGEGRTGNKAWLRRRLHAAIVPCGCARVPGSLS